MNSAFNWRGPSRFLTEQPIVFGTMAYRSWLVHCREIVKPKSWEKFRAEYEHAQERKNAKAHATRQNNEATLGVFVGIKSLVKERV